MCSNPGLQPPLTHTHSLQRIPSPQPPIRISLPIPVSPFSRILRVVSGPRSPPLLRQSFHVKICIVIVLSLMSQQGTFAPASRARGGRASFTPHVHATPFSVRTPTRALDNTYFEVNGNTHVDVIDTHTSILHNAYFNVLMTIHILRLMTIHRHRHPYIHS